MPNPLVSSLGYYNHFSAWMGQFFFLPVFLFLLVPRTMKMLSAHSTTSWKRIFPPPPYWTLLPLFWIENQDSELLHWCVFILLLLASRQVSPLGLQVSIEDTKHLQMSPWQHPGALHLCLLILLRSHSITPPTHQTSLSSQSPLILSFHCTFLTTPITCCRQLSSSVVSWTFCSAALRTAWLKKNTCISASSVLYMAEAWCKDFLKTKLDGYCQDDISECSHKLEVAAFRIQYSPGIRMKHWRMTAAKAYNQ